MEPIHPATLRSTRLAAISEEEDCPLHEFTLPNSIVPVAASDISR